MSNVPLASWILSFLAGVIFMDTLVLQNFHWWIWHYILDPEGKGLVIIVLAIPLVVASGLLRLRTRSPSGFLDLAFWVLVLISVFAAPYSPLPHYFLAPILVLIPSVGICKVRFELAKTKKPESI